MKIQSLLFIFLFISALISCSGGNGSDRRVDSTEAVVSGDATTALTTPITLSYAKGFHITYKENYCLVDIQDPQNENLPKFHFALVPQRIEIPDLPEDFEIIRVPIRKAICMTSLQLSGFIKLGETDHVVGITSARHLFNQEINQRIEQGLTAKIGIEGNFDNEVIISLDPDLILISPFKRGGYDALKEMDIPLMPYLGYKEMTPLGQAEWIKFVGLLLGEEKKANEIFASIENRYNELKTMAANVKERPVVFSGELRGGNWYAVGGKSFLAQQFHDAGADYFLKDDKRSGGVYLDYETVYSQAENAQFWRIVNSDEAFSYETLGASDTRYQDFRAFREHGIIYCNIRQHPFYESMPMEPEVVLADLIKAFHPQLLPDYQPVYYKRLP